MKFCANCGNQLEDNAAFCPGCGTQQPAPVVQAPVYAPAPAPVPTAAPAPAAAPAKEKKSIVNLFAFIGDLVAIISGFFAMISVALAYIDVNVYISKYTSGINAYGYLEVDESCAILSFLLSFGVIGAGVLELISSLKNRKGQEGLFKSIKKITLGTFLCILGIVLMTQI